MSAEQITSEPIHLDFLQYLSYSHDELLKELADAHQAIANLAVDIAFLKEEEEREGARHVKALRRQMEGTREAYVEKKWLVKTLLEQGK